MRAKWVLAGPAAAVCLSAAAFAQSAPLSPAAGPAADNASGKAAPATSNFSMVGFEIDLTNAEGYGASIDDVLAACDLYEIAGDNFACMQQKDNGGQVWLGLRIDGDAAQVITANPAFVGKSRFPVIVEGRTSDADWEPFEYQLAVTFSEFEIPLLVELADPREAAAFAESGPQRAAMLDLTAFVFQPEIFASSDTFLKVQADTNTEPQLASDFFVPSGLFGEKPSARASFAGKVIEAELMTTKDGASHWRTLVEVLDGATINVVFDDSAIEQPPEKGNLIVGDYWLSARVLGS